MFEDIDFSPGIITYNDLDMDLVAFLKTKQIAEKDLMQITYPNGFLLDVGWRNGKYIVCVVKNYNWENCVFKQTCKTLDELKQVLRECVNNIKTLIQKENAKNAEKKHLLNDFDFSPGCIDYSDLFIDPTQTLDKNCNFLPEDLAQITYPHGIVISIRNNHDEIVTSVVGNYQWDNPMLSKTSKTLEKLNEDIQECIAMARELNK